MKLAVLFVVGVCYFHSLTRCVNAQISTMTELPAAVDMVTPSPTPTPIPGTIDTENMTTDSENMTTDSENMTTDSENMTTTDMESVTTMSTNETESGVGQQSGLSTGGIVGIVVGVVALVVLVTLLVTIVIILSLKSVKAKKTLQVSPVKAKAKDSMPKPTDSKMTSHGKSVGMEELPIVDSS